MLSLFANLFIRSALILGPGALLCRLFPRLRAAQRHRILLAAFVLLFVWPLLAGMLPGWTLPFASHRSTAATVTVQQYVVDTRSAAAANAFAPSPVFIWAAVVGLALAPWLLAQLRLRALVKRSIVCHDTALLRQLSFELNIANPPVLLIHPERIMPMASGLLHRAIILPAASRDWTQDRLRMVLLHELAHIARRDLLALYFARLLSAVWWFQPLTWGVLRLLRRESEQACDELVIASGVRPSDYATELLAIAHSFTSSTLGVAMARQDSLESRLHAILGSPSKLSRPSRLVAVSLVCLTALTFAVSAVTLSPLQTRGQTMKHTLLAGLLVSAGLTTVTNAKALLYEPDTRAKFEATATADGKFLFETLPAGQYILRVQIPGSATLFRELNVKADGQFDSAFTLNEGKWQGTVSTPATGSPSPAVSTSIDNKRPHVDKAVAEANLVKKVQPVYPQAAKDAHVQGRVNLEMVISKEGVPLDIRVVSSPSDDLTESALEAVRQWRYNPILLNGNAVEVVTEVFINYTLSN